MKTEKLASLSTEDLAKVKANVERAGESPFAKYWLKAPIAPLNPAIC